MRLILVHRIMIGASIALAMVFALASLANFFITEPQALRHLVAAGIASGIGLGLWIYLKAYIRKHAVTPPPAEGDLKSEASEGGLAPDPAPTEPAVDSEDVTVVEPQADPPPADVPVEDDDT